MFDITTLATFLHLGNIFKIGLLLVLLLFIIFLFVILKQIQSMNKIVTQPYIYPLLLLVAWILIGLALALFVVSVVIL